MTTALASSAATLVVSDTESRCSACGHNSLITATHHTTPPGWSGRRPEPGCGVSYEAVAGDINGRSEPRWVAEELGLPYVGRKPFPTRPRKEETHA